jgi:glycosyltransferase involved in cell wall biosynthesis
LEWLAAQCSDLELFQSSADFARASRLRMKQLSKMRLIGNGVDLSRFNPEMIDASRIAAVRQSLGIASGRRVVGTVGRLVRDKGYVELFDAAHEVRRRFPDVVFLVVGDRDPDKEDAIGEAEMRRQPNVVFAGWREDMPEVYALMDVFALPTWREGFPRSPMEAAAMGKPLVLSDIPGCREVAREGVEALFVPPRDPPSLAEAIVSVLADPARGSRMGRAARMRALNQFDEARVAEIVLHSTRTTLARKGVRAELDAGVPR